MNAAPMEEGAPTAGEQGYEALELDKIYSCDAIVGLKGLATASVDCVVTSPPYWAVRDFAVGPTRWADGSVHALGFEPTFALYLDHLLEVLVELERVVKPSGTIWINIGDCYASRTVRPMLTNVPAGSSAERKAKGVGREEVPRNKSLCLVPERLAARLVDRGWVLRNRVVWAKPNCAPTNVRDRFVCSWEHLYFFTLSERYSFDLNSVRAPHASPEANRGRKSSATAERVRLPDGRYKIPKVFHPLGRNPGDVWRIPTRSSPTGHPAAFPEELCERPILAGCPAGGVVLDPFMGSGTVAVVAKRLGRRFIGFEPNEEYLRAALGRLAASPGASGLGERKAA